MKELIERLQGDGFSWQHADYFLLKENLANMQAVCEAAEWLVECKRVRDWDLLVIWQAMHAWPYYSTAKASAIDEIELSIEYAFYDNLNTAVDKWRKLAE